MSGYVTKTKRDVAEANRDVTESSDFDFETHAILRWFVNFLMDECHILF